jgi:hypothetical protein
MKAKAIASLWVFGCALPALGQVASTPEALVGEVNATNVYVRSLPEIEAYPCAKISKPARVTVVGKLRDVWLRILPVEGCFSVIDKKDVALDATRGVGTVTSRLAYVRAGGVLRTSKFLIIHRRLERGAKVQVVDRIGDYYVIVPPQGACYYIAAKYVDILGPVGRVPETAPTRIIATTQPVEQVKQLKAAWEAAEKALQAEYRKPLDKRDFPTLMARYRSLKVPDDSYLRPFVEARIRFLEEEIRQKSQLRSLSEYVRQAAARQRKLEELQAKLEMGAPTTKPAIAFAAEGILAPSELFPGGPLGPKRYIVWDAESLRITAFVQCTTGMVDLSQYVNKHVGIFGSKEFDKKLMTDLVEARQVRVLADKPSVPAPPKPVVRFRGPPPAPEPKEPPKAPPETITPRPIPGGEGPGKPLPKTGLPVVSPETRPATNPVDVKEYD